jgi:glutathione S-transferase
MSIVRTLHHFPLDPASRQARLALAEKRLPFEQVEVRYWERPKDFMVLNPSGLTPVLVEQTGDHKVVVCEIRAILEHLETTAPEYDLLGA